MVYVHCPYCGSDFLNWNNYTDSVKWSDDESGLIMTYGLRCNNPGCKGSKGFSFEVGFIAGDEVDYYDNHGIEIEED